MRTSLTADNLPGSLCHARGTFYGAGFERLQPTFLGVSARS